MASFKAIVIEKADSGTKAALADFDEANLMDGDVTVRVEYSTLNYKDGLAITGKAPVVRRFPMIAGIDFAGTVEASTHAAWKPGDKVILNGWGCGETHLGAYAEKARVKGDWLVRLPASMSAREAMAIGTAGYTAMLAVMALERHGLNPDERAGGGDGRGRRRRLGGHRHPRQARLYRARGHRAPREADYLKGLGAAEIVERKELGRAGQAARQGALGGRRRFGRLHDAGQPAVDDPLWRGGGGLRPGRRHGSADLGRPLHSSRGVSLRHRFRHVPAANAAGGVEKAGNRPGPPKTSLDYPGNWLVRGPGRGRRKSWPARCAAGSWSKSGKLVQDLSTKAGHSLGSLENRPWLL